MGLNGNKIGLFCLTFYSEDTLSIDPRKKERVEPESFVQLKVTLIPSIIPSFYEGEIEFSITWLNDDEPRERNEIFKMYRANHDLNII